jgi:hypothetical protein
MQGVDVASYGVVFGCDIARFGGDESCVVARQGKRVMFIESWQGANLMETTGRIVRLSSSYGPERINVDEVGLGGGVVDRLRELGLPVHGVNAGAASSDPERYVNLRAEMWWTLAERFREGAIDLPPDEVLAGQLTAVRYKYDSRGRLQIESKDESRKRGVSSPDRAEALMHAYYSPPPRPVVRTGAVSVVM